MTTLMAALENAKNPAIIFGTLHRRQKEISGSVRGAKYEYTNLSSDELLDLSFIKSFNLVLSGPYSVDTMEMWEADLTTKVKLEKARTAIGIDDATNRKHCRAGTRAAVNVMFGFGPRLHQNEERYCAILEEGRTATAKAA